MAGWQILINGEGTRDMRTIQLLDTIAGAKKFETILRDVTNMNTLKHFDDVEIWAPTTSPPGGLIFDGTDDHIRCGNDTSLDMTTEIMVSAWIKTSDTATQFIVSKYSLASDASYELYCSLLNGARFRLYDSVGAVTVNSNFGVQDGEWHHIVGTLSGTTMSIYVDGELKNTGTLNNSIKVTTNILNIGRRGNDTLHFNGSIADVRIYNKNWGIDEVTRLYNGIYTTPCTAFYTLNQSSVDDDAIYDRFEKSHGTSYTGATTKGALTVDTSPLDQFIAFKGHIETIIPDYDTNTLIITGRDYLGSLLRRAVVESYTTQARSDIVDDIILKYGEDMTRRNIDISPGKTGYIQSLTLTGAASGAQTDYQIKLDVTYSVGMNTDFSDVVFRDSSDVILDSWLESKIDSTSAIIWVKFPTTPANGITEDYYMCYGNLAITADWNGDDTFLLFDDFDGALIDTDKWDCTTPPTVFGGKARFSGSRDIKSKLAYDFAQPCTTILNMDIDTIPIGNTEAVWSSRLTDRNSVIASEGAAWYREGSYDRYIYGVTNDFWSGTDKGAVLGDSRHEITGVDPSDFKWKVTGSQTFDDTRNETNNYPDCSTRYLNFLTHYSMADVSLYWIAVPKYVANPATYGFGSATNSTHLTYLFKTSAWDAVVKCASEDGYRFWCDVDKDFHYHTKGYVDSGITLETGISNILRYNIIESTADVINRVIIYGQEVAGTQVVAMVEDVTSQTYYGGIFEKRLVDNSIESEDDAIIYGESYLTEHSYVIEIAEIEMLGNETLTAGEMISLKIPSINIDGSYLIIEKELSYPTGSTKIKLAKYAKNLEGLISSMVEKILMLERHFMDEGSTITKIHRVRDEILYTDRIVIDKKALSDSFKIGIEGWCTIGKTKIGGRGNVWTNVYDSG